MRLYFRNRKSLDLVFSFFLCLFIFYYPNRPIIFSYPEISAREDLAIAILGTSASLLGFVLAASTFLISHIQGPRFSILRNSRAYIQLPQLVGSNLWRLLLLTIFSGLINTLQPQFMLFGIKILVFIISWCLTTFIALLWVVIKIYSIPLPDRD